MQKRFLSLILALFILVCMPFAHATKFSDVMERRVNDLITGNGSFPQITTYIGLYTSDPTDANSGTEVSGGSYARQALTSKFPAASGTTGSVTNSGGAITFPTATGSWGTLAYFGYFDNVSTISKTFTTSDVSTTNEEVTISSHGFTTGDPVLLTTSGSLPGGLATTRYYFVRAVSSSIISFYPTAADASANTNKIDITSVGSGTQTVITGNLLMHGALTTSKTVNSGDTATFNSSSLTITVD